MTEENVWLKELTAHIQYVNHMGLNDYVWGGREYHCFVVHMQMLGVAKGCLESVLPYIHDRMAFGQPIADFQV